MIRIHKSREYIKRLNVNISKENNGLIGSTLYSNTCGKFKIISKCNRIKNHTTYLVEFIETKNRYKCRGDLLLNGEIKDYEYPSVYDIGYLGKDFKSLKKSNPILCKSLYRRWRSMLGRCYYTRDSSYKFYGLKGITVDDRWLNFSNYYNDITSLDDFDETKFINGDIVIDKDIKQHGIRQKIYSKDTITLTTNLNNLQNRDLHNCGQTTANKFSKYFACIDIIDNTISYHKNICSFSRLNNINDSSIRDSLHNRTKLVKNRYTFRFLTYDEINKIKSNIIVLDIIYGNK